jgi:hypothetical protein
MSKLNEVLLYIDNLQIDENIYKNISKTYIKITKLKSKDATKATLHLFDFLIKNNNYDPLIFYLMEYEKKSFIDILIKYDKLEDITHYIFSKNENKDVHSMYLAELVKEFNKTKSILDMIRQKYSFAKINIGDLINLTFESEEPLEDDVVEYINKYLKEKETRDIKICENDREYCNYTDEKIIPIDILPYPLVKSVLSIEIPIYKYGFKIGSFNPEYLKSFPEPEYKISKVYIRKDNRAGCFNNVFDDISDIFKFPLEWFKQCNVYISNLSIEDKFKIISYTFNGDQIANLYLYDKENYVSYINEKINNKSSYQNNYFPLYFNIKEFLIQQHKINYKDMDKYIHNFNEKSSHKEMLNNIIKDNTESYITLIKNLNKFNIEFYSFITEFYINDLNKIINNSPKFPEDCILYRGVKDKYYKSEDSDEYYNLSFMSTSYDKEVAYSFTNKEDPGSSKDTECCIKKIMVPKGARGIFMECITVIPSESEILLATNNKFKILDENIEQYNKTNPDFDANMKDFICENKIKNMSITKMEMII